MKDIKSPPKASSLIESLRDIGYSLETAVADIIDNSITAQANKINIFFNWNKQQSNLAIIDNGYGMSYEELVEAMRPGTISPLEDRDKKDLGRFGLGLKTASFSQCRKLTVASKIEGGLSGCCWDLDYVEKEDDWLLHVLNSSEINLKMYSEKLSETGTLVLWENLDRVVDSTDRRNIEANLYEKIDLTRRHLELVFHRYLKGEPGIPSIEISINHDPLKPFDPFNVKHPATQHLTEEKITIEGETIVIQPYILPHHNKTTPKEYEYYAGEGGYLKNQGFYVYRNSRLLISGTWFRLAKQSELTKLARIKIDLPNNLDHLWLIDVKKSRATPPEIIKQRLKSIIDKITGSSKRVYTVRGTRLTQKDLNVFWNRNVDKNKIFYTMNKDHPLIINFVLSLDDQQKEHFNNIAELIESHFPVDSFYADVSNSPETLSQSRIEKDKIIELMTLFYDELYRQGMKPEEILKQFERTEPFRNHSKLCKEFMESKGN